MFPKQQVVITGDAINYVHMKTILHYFICNAVYFYTHHNVICMEHWKTFILKYWSYIWKSIGATTHLHNSILKWYITVSVSQQIRSYTVTTCPATDTGTLCCFSPFFLSFPGCNQSTPWRRYNWICIKRYNMRKLNWVLVGYSHMYILQMKLFNT